MPKTLILIPSRLSATRLPGKPLLKINGISIISSVYKKAKETGLGKVYVATEDKEIFNDVTNNGGNCILTSNTHKTGTDRIFEAYKKLNISNIDYILNLQGDEPLIDINDIKNLNIKLINSKSEMGTLACKIKDNKKYEDENIVKVKTFRELSNENLSQAQDFFRSCAKKNLDNIYHHIGIYQYKVSTLERLISIKQSINEKKHRLEQLRALENNVKIDVLLAKKSPIGVDTLEEYKKVKKILETKN